MNLSARQMLAAMPVRRFADGGDATNVVPSWQADASAGRARAIANGNEAGWLANVKASADKYMTNPGTAAEAYDAMVKSGIGIQDLLDSGVSQETISRALSIPTPEAQKQVNALATTAITSTLAQNPTLASAIASRGAPAIYEQARQFVANLQKDGLTNEERQYMQQVASQQGWGYSDIRAAGIDPTILFNQPQTPQPVTPTPIFPAPVPHTPVTVYDPEKFIRENAGDDLYKKGEIALDTAFRESAPRTEIPGMPGSYEYTPAASLRPATGAGYSWTPPVVTSRPRSLLSPTLLSYTSPSQQFAQTRATQDQALLAAFRNSGLPQNASNFYSWRNRLRSGEFGSGAAFNPNAFQSAFGSWASTQQPAGGATAQGTAPVGDVTGYSEIAQGLPGTYNVYGESSGMPYTGTLQPVDLRVMPVGKADGGEVSSREMLERLKKPEGTEADGLGAEEQTQSRSLLQKLLSLDTPQDMSLGETALDIGAGFLPGIGTAQGARDFERARRERDMLGMGLSAMSMIPIAGGAVRLARRAGKVADILPAGSTERLANLERYMAGSRVIDEEGNPLRMYHGAKEDISDGIFRMEKGMLGTGSYFTRSPEEADFYTSNAVWKTEPNIVPAFISIKNPYITSDKWDRGALKAKENGYDGVILLDKNGKIEWAIPFDSTQVKSAIGNEGTFDPANPVITKADGGEVTTEELLAQMDRIGGQPVPGVRRPQTESRSMLQNLMQGAREIPGTLSRYGARVAGSESPMATLGQDLSKFGGAVAQGFKESPGEFLLDVLPVVGELRSASDVDKFSQMANEAEAQGNMDLARIYRELVAVSAMGAAPLAGMGARAGKSALKGPVVGGAVRMARKAGKVADAVPGQARQMLDAIPTPAQAPRLPEVGSPVSVGQLRQSGASPADLSQLEQAFRAHQSGVQSVDDLISMATRVDPMFQGSVRDAASSVGGTYVPGPVKSAQSITDKLSRKGGTAAGIPDALRATVLVENNAQAEDVVRQIASRFPAIDEGWQRIPSNNYIDRKVAIQFTGPNGERLLGEIQINTPSMQQAKDTAGHGLYEIERRLTQNYGSRGQMPAEELMRYEEALQAQTKLYGDAATQIDPSILEQVSDRRAHGGYVGRLGRL